MRPVFSVVVPCYNEEDCILATHGRLTAVMAGMGEPYELLFVNDGSRDATPQMLDELSARDPMVKVVHFARNAGHQAAVSAGMDYASGEAVVIIDADLQDPPEVIPEMARLWREGAQVVYGKRKSRAGEGLLKKWTAKWFYRLLRKLAGDAFPEDTGDFRLADRKVVDVVKAMPEHARYLRGMFAWAGFQQVPLEYDREARFAGETHYPLKKMLRLAANGVMSFSEKPLHLALWLGLLWLLAGGVTLLILLVSELMGWGTMRLGLPVLVCLATGSILLAIWIVGAYLARVYEEVKGRPLYVVAATRGFEPKETRLPPGARVRS